MKYCASEFLLLNTISGGERLLGLVLPKELPQESAALMELALIKAIGHGLVTRDFLMTRKGNREALVIARYRQAERHIQFNNVWVAILGNKESMALLNEDDYAQLLSIHPVDFMLRISGDSAQQ